MANLALVPPQPNTTLRYNQDKFTVLQFIKSHCVDLMTFANSALKFHRLFCRKWSRSATRELKKSAVELSSQWHWPLMDTFTHLDRVRCFKNDVYCIFIFYILWSKLVCRIHYF